jgi:glycosyltransferase involved in cell wall biosynthesis
MTPFLSVIVPAFNGTRLLPKTLDALFASDLPRDCWELIVVDDASTDGTSELAARYADVVVRLSGHPRGPAYARNRGFDAACGEVVVFVDADVCVHPDTLRRFAWTFAREPEVAAVFGSYDNAPPAPGLVSQYRNLLHHYHHQQNRGDAETFWAGCGAIRAHVFEEAGKYDEWHFPRPQIEDIELGHRIRALGYRILLRPEIQGTHLKHWTLRNVIVTDVKERGIPWMRLLLTERRTSTMTSLNLKTIEKVNTALVGLALLSVPVAAVLRDPRWLSGLALFLVPVVTNLDLYEFYRRERGLWFALRVLPLHLMYYFLNGCSAILGYLLHHTVGAPSPAPEVQALAEVGVKTWPPIPAKAKGSGWLRGS